MRCALLASEFVHFGEHTQREEGTAQACARVREAAAAASVSDRRRGATVEGRGQRSGGAREEMAERRERVGLGGERGGEGYGHQDWARVVQIFDLGGGHA